MDSVNRDIAMKMMVGAARLAVSRQFILITPQSMANVSLGEDVKIHKYVISPMFFAAMAVSIPIHPCLAGEVPAPNGS